MNYKHFILLCFVVVYNPLFSQNTDSIVKPTDSIVHKNLIEKTMDIFEMEFGRVTVTSFPALNLDPSSGLNLGLVQVISIPPKVPNKYNRSTSLVNHLTYSTQNWLNLKSDLILYTQKGYNVNMYIQYLQAPDKFYGIGNDTLNTKPIKFHINDIEFRGNVSKSIYSLLFTGIVFDVSYTVINPLETTTKGLNIPTQKNKLLLGVGPHLAFDTRNSVNYPTRGTYITAGFLYYPKHTINSYTFHTFLLDAKTYVSLRKELVLAAQLYTGQSGGDMPFYDLFQLGGKSRMRGISNKYMYINSDVSYVQAEIRQHIWGRFTGVAFGAVGNTAFAFNTFDVMNSKYVYGGGIRFQTSKSNKLHLRIDYGRGKYGDSGIYITMREAF